MNKNILVLNYEFPPIGWWAWRVSYEVAKLCSKQWYKVDVITMKYKDFSSEEEKDWFTIYRVNCIRKKINVSQRWEQFTYLISAFFKVVKLLRKKTYLWSYCFFLVPTGILSLLLKKIFWLKYIVLARWSDVPWYNSDRFTVMHRFTPWILKRIINNSEAVIANSEYLKSLIKKNIKGINKDINVIHNWVDIDEIKPWEKKKIILWTWRLWPLKWFQLLVRAFSNIQDVNWYELHICWDWPMMDDLVKIQQQSKNKIVLHWWIDNKSDEYKELLSSAKILCHPSNSDSSPNSLLEWLAAWCVVVSTNIWWCKEIVWDVWFLVDFSIDSIENTLKILLSDDDKLKKYSKKSRDLAVKQFDKCLMYSKYSMLFEKYVW